MKYKFKLFFILAFVTATIFNSCSRKKITETKPKKDTALIIGNPFDYGMDNILIFPVGSNYKPIIYGDSRDDSDTKTLGNEYEKLSFAVNSSTLFDRNAEVEYKNTNEDKFDIRNILFYNNKTGITYPLVSDTLHILSFAMHKEFGKPLIFYRVVKKDNNKDSIFNSKDPVMLFISDMLGHNFTQITPSDEQYSDYDYYSRTQTILIKSIIDSDKDFNFSNFDETNFREMKINNPTMGREIFRKSLKDSLRQQLKVF